MFALRFPKSPRNRVVFLVLGLLVVAWVSHLAIELGVELRLRQKGASVWRSCGRVTDLDFPRENSFDAEDLELVTWLGGLRRLDVSHTQANHQGMVQVRSLRHLTFLEVRHEQITPEQAQELEQDLPYLKIHYRDAGLTR